MKNEETIIMQPDNNENTNNVKAEKEVIEQTIMALMKENETAYVKDRKVTWKKSVRVSIDAKRLKEEEPQIYEKYSKVVSSRIFKIK